MSLKKLGAVMVAVLAIGAIVASSASAAVSTSAAQWYTGTGTGTTLAGEQAITASIGTNSEVGAKFVLKSTIAGKTVELNATGVECVGCKISNAEVTSTAGKVAIGKGKIKFSGVTAVKPTGCTVRNKTETGTAGVIETNALEVHADWMESTTAFQQFFPESGTTFATVYLGGGECEAIEGPYNVTGTVWSQAANATGVQEASQANTFSPAIQTKAGAELKLGANKAELTGTGVFSIGGTAFGIH
jgi:hypothetical protein